jgi:hypothetical protein
MFIQTEATPNPATLKFIPGKTVLEGETRDFRSADEAGISPLATALFHIDGVQGVYFGQDFIAVTKDDHDWAHMKPAILGAIMEHFMSGAPLLAETDGSQGIGQEDYAPEDEEIVTTIKDLLETRVRPAVAQDGGDITFQLEGVFELRIC